MKIPGLPNTGGISRYSFFLVLQVLLQRFYVVPVWPTTKHRCDDFCAKYYDHCFVRSGRSRPRRTFIQTLLQTERRSPHK